MTKGKNTLGALAIALMLAAVMGAGVLYAAQSQPQAVGVSTAANNSQGEHEHDDADAAGGPRGIWVSGEGKLSVEPDVAILGLGVESTGQTVHEANTRAGESMDAVQQALTDSGVAEADMQTSRFNIYPRYEWRERTERGVQTSERVLVEYQVTNSVRVKIRELDEVGNIIDAVVSAGGNDVRIDHINFTVEDTTEQMAELRRLAVADAMAKAEHLAELGGVAVGKMLYISEGVNAPSPFEYSLRASPEFAAAASDAVISHGEVELSLRVQAVFAID